MSVEKYQPTPEETQKAEEMMDYEEKKRSLERERVQEEGAEASLLRYAQELNYDDRCGGKAVQVFREQLETIAKHVEELESVGYKVRVRCTPVALGSAVVYLERGGESIQIYSKFYDTYSDGFGVDVYTVYDIKKNIEMALKMARMFRGESKEE